MGWIKDAVGIKMKFLKHFVILSVAKDLGNILYIIKVLSPYGRLMSCWGLAFIFSTHSHPLCKGVTESEREAHRGTSDGNFIVTFRLSGRMKFWMSEGGFHYFSYSGRKTTHRVSKTKKIPYFCKKNGSQERFVLNFFYFCTVARCNRHICRKAFSFIPNRWIWTIQRVRNE